MGRIFLFNEKITLSQYISISKRFYTLKTLSLARLYDPKLYSLEYDSLEYDDLHELAMLNYNQYKLSPFKKNSVYTYTLKDYSCNKSEYNQLSQACCSDTISQGYHMNGATNNARQKLIRRRYR